MARANVKSMPEYADERQLELHKKMPNGHFLSNQENVHKFLLWNTFFRRNLHRFAQILNINLYLYQAIMLYMMGISKLCVVIACRAAAKSFMISVYAVCVCILRPYSTIVIASATKGQSKLIITEKIQKELCNSAHPLIQQEIISIKSSQDESYVKFRNGSIIKVVVANENGRGNRSTVLIREEYRQINKHVDDSILSPFQVTRQAPYITSGAYTGLPDAIDKPVDIYISSSWLDAHWMWGVADQAFKESFLSNDSVTLAFDESVVLKYGIKDIDSLRKEKRKQDSLTWRIEFLNERVKENTSAYFTYSMLQRNQKLKKAFYPRKNEEALTGKKNLHVIPKQPNEVRVVCCDMAFVEGKGNDNSIFSLGRLIPEFTKHNRGENQEGFEVSNGYRVMVPYIESIQGGDTGAQALRIRQLYEDFEADYIVLDTRNAGIAIFDSLAKIMYDDERDVEYSPLTCMNDESLANRTRFEGAEPRIFAINASQKLNSDIAINFRRYLIDEKIDLLISFQKAQEEILPKIKEYTLSPSADGQLFYENPYLETQALISETTELVYEKKEQTGAIVIREQGNSRKDRYTSVSYLCYFADKLSQDLGTYNEDYQFSVLIN